MAGELARIINDDGMRSVRVEHSLYEEVLTDERDRQHFIELYVEERKKELSGPMDVEAPNGHGAAEAHARDEVLGPRPFRPLLPQVEVSFARAS